ncbi:10668_t:CDS:1 [Paraglomus occultum]|uniref:10668_t:CDS:1 n=1 Tax=Paraglomus occultum TaxID=144539 RepID=A0A9N9BSK7_9GLOM|nr:10668_t:CDS:1 [Paraglomus occultum]
MLNQNHNALKRPHYHPDKASSALDNEGNSKRQRISPTFPVSSLLYETFFTSCRNALTTSRNTPQNTTITTSWEPGEQNRFFIALARCGKHNVVEISKRVGTKSVSQILLYIDELEKGLRLEKLKERFEKENKTRIKNRRRLYLKMQAAREMSDEWIEMEERRSLELAAVDDAKARKHESNVAASRRITLSLNDSILDLETASSFAERVIGSENDCMVSRHTLVQLRAELKRWVSLIVRDIIVLRRLRSASSEIEVCELGN